MNYLNKLWGELVFSDTPKGACVSSAYYCLIEIAKANQLEPYTCLVLERVRVEVCFDQNLTKV